MIRALNVLTMSQGIRTGLVEVWPWDTPDLLYIHYDSSGFRTSNLDDIGLPYVTSLCMDMHNWTLIASNADPPTAGADSGVQGR